MFNGNVGNGIEYTHIKVTYIDTVDFTNKKHR